MVRDALKRALLTMRTVVVRLNSRMLDSPGTAADGFDRDQYPAPPADVRKNVPEQMFMSLIARILLLLAAPIAALFVARDALNFGVVQMVVATILFTAMVAAAAFWPRRRPR
ncbi:hypothetical protein V1282_004638 [Nitrobacteraceae bacterium AZCC 2146]|jgi:hypothetical protein